MPRLTPWQRAYLLAVTPGHPSHAWALRLVYSWTPSRYRKVRDTLRRMGAISEDGRPTQTGAEALAK